jgi:hypothetical protein
MNALMKRLALALAAAVLLPCPAPVHAQTGPETVPLEFLELLWLSPFGGRAEPAVGRLPERLAADLGTFTDARIVGSMIARTFSVSAVVVPGSPGAVQERVQARLLEAGWTKQSQMERPTVGFETAETSRARQLSFCRADEHNLHLLAAGHRGDSAVVSLTLLSGRYTEQCGDRELPPPRRFEAPIPVLRAPEGSQHRGGGSGGGGNDSYASARLRTDMKPAVLLAYYAPQLMAQGWRAGPQTAADDVALQVFSTIDASGVAWRGVLYVTLLSNGDRDLYLRVTRDR